MKIKTLLLINFIIFSLMIIWFFPYISYDQRFMGFSEPVILTPKILPAESVKKLLDSKRTTK